MLVLVFGCDKFEEPWKKEINWNDPCSWEQYIPVMKDHFHTSRNGSRYEVEPTPDEWAAFCEQWRGDLYGDLGQYEIWGPNLSVGKYSIRTINGPLVLYLSDYMFVFGIYTIKYAAGEPFERDYEVCQEYNLNNIFDETDSLIVKLDKVLLESICGSAVNYGKFIPIIPTVYPYQTKVVIYRQRDKAFHKEYLK